MKWLLLIRMGQVAQVGCLKLIFFAGNEEGFMMVGGCDVCSVDSIALVDALVSIFPKFGGAL